jgi:hypothetical protein
VAPAGRPFLSDFALDTLECLDATHGGNKGNNAAIVTELAAACGDDRDCWLGFPNDFYLEYRTPRDWIWLCTSPLRDQS